MSELILEEAIANMGDENATYESYCAKLSEDVEVEYLVELMRNDLTKDAAADEADIEEQFNTNSMTDMDTYNNNPEYYKDDEDDADVPQAKGTSFEDIDTAVKTVKASKATDKEKRHAGKVFHEMDGNQFYEKFMENSKECKKNIHDFVTFYLQTHKIEEISKPKKEFKVPDSIEDFNILDFV